MHRVYDTPESGKQTAVLIDSVYLHKFVYFAISTDGWKVYKAFGKPDKLKIHLVIDLNDYKQYTNFGPILNMYSMDTFGFYTTTKHSRYVH